MSEKSTTADQAARRIAALLAQAEDAAKRGEERERDKYLEKASALQLQYVIDEAMLQRAGQKSSEEIVYADFCEESNSPLIKAKRTLIQAVATFNRGKVVLLGDYKTQKGGQRAGQRVYDRRAKMRVWAYESDLRFITTLYTSLLVQMETMMAADERGQGFAREAVAALGGSGRRTGAQAWWTSYAHGWTDRIWSRLQEIEIRNKQGAETSAPGTAIVLRDRNALVEQRFAEIYPNSKKFRAPRSDNSVAGRQAGRAAANRADLGQTRVATGQRGQLGSGTDR